MAKGLSFKDEKRKTFQKKTDEDWHFVKDRLGYAGIGKQQQTRCKIINEKDDKHTYKNTEENDISTRFAWNSGIEINEMNELMNEWRLTQLTDEAVMWIPNKDEYRFWK